MDPWNYITHFGAAGLLMPLAALVAFGLWLGGQRRALWLWAATLSVGSGLVLSTKIAFMGWGIGSAAFNFTGISGHATLATSILPMAMALLLSRTHRQARLWGLVLGLLIGAAVSASRVHVGAHSVSEVIAGFALGSAISIAAIRYLHPPTTNAPVWMPVLGLMVMLAFHQVLPEQVPTHDWEKRIAMKLSGRDKPYSREMMLNRIDNDA